MNSNDCSNYVMFLVILLYYLVNFYGRIYLAISYRFFNANSFTHFASFLPYFFVRKWIKLFAIRINHKYYSQEQNENGMR